jgi:hypothetical protein
MTREMFYCQMLEQLPPLRRRLAGTDRVKKVVDLCLRQFPAVQMGTAQPGSAHERTAVEEWESSVNTIGESEFGPLFWMILAPFVHYIITELIERWRDSNVNKLHIVGWRKELRNVRRNLKQGY